MKQKELKNVKLPQNACYELRRCGIQNPLLDRDLPMYKRRCEEDEKMDDCYKILLSSLLSKGDQLIVPKTIAQKIKEKGDKPSLPLPMKEANGVDPHMKQVDKARSSEHGKFSGEETRKAMEERLELQTKQKGKSILIEQENVGGNAVQENHHPDYEVLLKRLKEYKLKSCEGKSKNDSYYVDTKRKEDIGGNAVKAFKKRCKLRHKENGKAPGEVSGQHQKGKGKGLLIESDDGENAVQENHHPDYEALLKRLKEYKLKSCECKSKNDSYYVDTKRKEDIGGNAVKAFKKRCEPHQKGKGKGLLIASDDDDENAVQENHHPDYEALLKRLKEYKLKSCEGKSKNDSYYVDTKRKEDIGGNAVKAFKKRCELRQKENGKAPGEVSQQHQKGKGKGLLIESDDGENAVQGNHHPDYEALLKRLKEYKLKSCEGKSKNDSYYVDTKRKEDIGGNAVKAFKKRCEPHQKGKGKGLLIASDDDGENAVQENHHPDYAVLLKHLKEYKLKSCEGKSKNDSYFVDTKRKEDIGSGKKSSRFISTSRPCLAQKTRDDNEKCVLRKRVSSEFRNASMKRKSRSCESRIEIVEVTTDEDDNAVRKSVSRRKEAFGPSSEFTKASMKRKSRGCESRDEIVEVMTDEDDNAVRKRVSRRKEAFGPSSEFRKASMKRKTRSCESRDEVVEVTTDEDGNAVIKSVSRRKEAFGPSVKFRDVGGNSRVTPTDKKAEFRKRILEIISKPFDKIEYRIIKKEFNAQSYTDYYPDLRKELVKNRYNPRKRLALLRGFYFWMQNIMREGAFKPWTDDICLAVEPQPLTPGNNS